MFHVIKHHKLLDWEYFVVSHCLNANFNSGNILDVYQDIKIIAEENLVIWRISQDLIYEIKWKVFLK